jgi:hypothetical protein
MITEDGFVHRSEEALEEDLNGADDGYLDIINVENFTQYYEGEWTPLSIWR